VSTGDPVSPTPHRVGAILTPGTCLAHTSTPSTAETPRVHRMCLPSTTGPSDQDPPVVLTPQFTARPPASSALSGAESCDPSSESGSGFSLSPSTPRMCCAKVGRAMVNLRAATSVSVVHVALDSMDSALELLLTMDTALHALPAPTRRALAQYLVELKSLAPVRRK